MQPAVNLYPVKEVEPVPEPLIGPRLLKKAEQQDLFRKQEAERVARERVEQTPIPHNLD